MSEFVEYLLGCLSLFFLISLQPSLFRILVHLGLLYAGDKLVEVNGVSVEGLDPEQVIHILVIVISLVPSEQMALTELIPLSPPCMV